VLGDMGKTEDALEAAAQALRLKSQGDAADMYLLRSPKVVRHAALRNVWLVSRRTIGSCPGAVEASGNRR